jgi:DNA-binding response OmpR family regulator
VVSVERASALEAALAAGPWSLACVDVELPDALGAELLSAVRERLPEETPLVALVRDDHDVTVARAAGVWRTLLKPVEPGALRRLLARLGLLERAS